MSQKSVQVRNQARLIVVGVALLFTLGMGIRQSFGLFVTPVTRDLALTAADFTLTLAIQNIVWGLSQAFVGATADRYGLRITMMVGAAIYILGLAIMAVAQGLLALIISGSLIGVALSCTATSLGIAACVRAVSEERRSMTLGLDVASESALAAGLVMGVMIIPFVSSLSDDVINAVPQAMRDGSYGIGATRSETIKRVIFPAALPGIRGSGEPCRPGATVN